MTTLIGKTFHIGVVAACIGHFAPAYAHQPHPFPAFGDQPLLFQHTSQEEISAHLHSFDFIKNVGLGLFVLPFSSVDGFGRPAATGNATPTMRPPIADPSKLMSALSGPDAQSCVGCHAIPNIGAAGDFAANIFHGAELSPQPVTVIRKEFNERNTLGMQGSGPIELLGREMTRDLFEIRQNAQRKAAKLGKPVSVPLETKGVFFGEITAFPNGSVDYSKIEGVDRDLIIKPFGRKGTARSLREFAVTALNRHHGIQATERFGIEQTGTDDFDQDGIADELSIGDVTALVVFQAQLETPVQNWPPNPEARQAALTGEKTFATIGCTSCHRVALKLDNPTFCEPYALNPNGTFADTALSYCFDLTTTGAGQRLQRDENGNVFVAAYTDLKRHKICDHEQPHFCNEQTPEKGVPPDQFLTRKLWDTGLGVGLHGHRGDLTTLKEAILAHGGEAKAARLRFAELSVTAQAEVVEFLKTLQIPLLPPPQVSLPVGLPGGVTP